jgi:anti-anti-sigma factor
MTGEFNLLTELHDKTLVMKTEGYINNVAGEKISEEFSKNFSGGVNKVIIDMEKSKVINSIGISYLLEVIEKLNESNGKLIFINLDPTIDKTLNIMGLFQFAEKADSIDSALK